MAHELKERRNKLMHDAGAIMQNKPLTREHRASFDAMMAEVDTLNEDITREERVAAFEAEQRRSGRPPRSQPGEHAATPESVAAQKRAFTNYLRTGRVSAELETRDLGAGAIAGNITGGSVLVPTGFYPDLILAKKSYGAIIDACDSLPTDHGNPIRVSYANDTGNGLVVLGETATASEADPAVSGITSNTDFVSTGVVKVSLGLLSQSAFDIEAFLRDSLMKRYYRGLSQFVTQGSSSGNVASLQASATLGVTTAAPTTIAYGDLVSLYGSLEAAYIEQSSFVMTSSTRAYLMGLTDNYGRPLLQSDLNGQPFNSIFGRPIVISQFSDPIVATKSPILFGSLREAYVVREAGGLAVSTLRERYLDSGEIGVIGFGLVGGFSKNAGVSPLVALKMHA